MDKFAEVVGRSYHLFDYVGAPDAERVIVMMGSGAEAAHETVDYLNARGEKVGLLKVRLYRPFSVKSFMEALPATVKKIAVLDRTKESGAIGEPLYLDVVNALNEGLKLGYGKLKTAPTVVGGRYGLSSKEFTPAMVKAVYDNLKKPEPKDHFTIGINDDVTHTSLDYDAAFSTEPDSVVRAMFYGLGADGTVGANKNSIKIIGENTDNYAQGYFVYDSKKSGAMTVSHLRFGPQPIHSSYLVSKANFVACHQWIFLERYDMLSALVEGGIFLLNSPFGKDEVWDHLPREVQQQLIAKKARFYVIDAYQVARDTGMGSRMNTIMQVCFFAISKVLPRDEAIEAIRKSIRDTYGRKGEEVVSEEHEGRGRNAGPSSRSEDSRSRQQQELDPRRVPRRSEVRARRARHDLRRQGRRTPGQRILLRRHLPHRHRASGRSAIWLSKFPRGIRRSASSAASAPWFARMPSSASRSTTARNWRALPPPSNPATPATRNGPA